MTVMKKAAEKAARSLKKDFLEVENLQVSRKGPKDFVSKADENAEQILYEALSKARPNYSFLMEESGAKGPDKYDFRFIIDPLDGTTNFLHGLPYWAIAIGLEEQTYKGTEIVAGLVYNPVTDDMYWAEKGKGAFHNNQRMRVSGRRRLADSMLNMNSVSNYTDLSDDHYWSMIGRISDQLAAVRAHGAGALGLCEVANGQTDMHWARRSEPWDVAAGIIIVREAGGMITGLNGERKDSDILLAGGSITANPHLHSKITNIINSDPR
jgi:myo-inositol-1(or 4)-monophosphatase